MVPVANPKAGSGARSLAKPKAKAAAPPAQAKPTAALAAKDGNRLAEGKRTKSKPADGKAGVPPVKTETAKTKPATAAVPQAKKVTQPKSMAKSKTPSEAKPVSGSKASSEAKPAAGTKAAPVGAKAPGSSAETQAVADEAVRPSVSRPPALKVVEGSVAEAPKAAVQPPLLKQPPKPMPLKVVEGSAEGPGFEVDDHVVYPTHGVGKITAIETQEIAGHILKVFVVQFEKDRMTLRVPVGKVRAAGLRRLSTRKEMDAALAKLRGRSRVKRTMWSRRAQEYEAKINSGDPASIAEVVRDLHRNAGQPDQSYSERQIYQAALDRLARELAAVERIDEESATQRLEKMLQVAA
jgi:CarD family transcriptional regulator